jgi:hypothetical protein
MSTSTRPKAGPPPRHDDLRALPDKHLLNVAIQCQVRNNRDTARAIETYAEMRRRCEADYEVRRSRGQSHFVITPLDETALELAGALHVDEHKVKLDLHVRDRLADWFPLLWDRCLSGRLDIGRARIFVDAAEQLANPDDIPEFARMVEDYFTKYDEADSPLVTISHRQLSNAARYRRLKFEQKSDDENFAAAFRKRRVWLRTDDNGMGTLGLTGAGHDLLSCDYRLTLIARKRCQDPTDDRTLEQMRADTMRDLILGRLTVSALDSDLEADQTSDGRDPAETFAEHEVGAFARPVINVTVPLSTLLGSSDEPGFLSGDTAIPADVARLIASDPTSTWHRLLTDEAGRFCDLSTKSYQPTAPIRRGVVARDRCCVWPGCQRPSAQCEVDHRVPHPDGATCLCNLDPLCHRHHMAKHSEGVSVTREADGTYVIRTRRGSVLRSRPGEQPLDGRDPPVDLRDAQPSDSEADPTAA